MSLETLNQRLEVASGRSRSHSFDGFGGFLISGSVASGFSRKAVVVAVYVFRNLPMTPPAIINRKKAAARGTESGVERTSTRPARMASQIASALRGASTSEYVVPICA